MRLILVAVLALGCGAPRLPGAPETGTACAGDEPKCMTAVSVGTCIDRKWTEWPCVDECSNDTTPRCEKMLPTKAGESCAPGSINGGAVACVAADGGPSMAILRCRGGVAAQEECVRCANHGLGFICE